MVINQQNSSDVWGGFRVAKRARSIGCEVTETNYSVKIRGGHTGYITNFSKTTHHRTWELGDNFLKLRDEIVGAGEKEVEINFHIHPSVLIEYINSKKINFTLPNGQKCLFESLSANDWIFKRGTFHPGFNKTVNSQILQINSKASLPTYFDFLLMWDRQK